MRQIGKGHSQTLVVWIGENLFGILVSSWNKWFISIVGTIVAHVPSQILEVNREVNIYEHEIYDA